MTSLLHVTEVTTDQALQLENLQLLPATAPEVIAALECFENQLIGQEPAKVPTEHVLHGGMYARTIAIPPGMVMTGAVIKLATMLIVVGSAEALAGDVWIELEGYNVLRGVAGRKALFVTRSTVVMTMVFPTSARTVEEAEREFTDDADRLLSRRQDANRVVITEED